MMPTQAQPVDRKGYERASRLSRREGFHDRVIDRHRFLFLVGETPNFALQVMASLAERLRASQA